MQLDFADMVYRYVFYFGKYDIMTVQDLNSVSAISGTECKTSGEVLSMSIDITIRQNGVLKKSLPFDVICGGLKYGSFDGLKLIEGEIGEDEFMLYHPSHLARGFSVVWKKGEKNQIYMHLPSPTCAEETDDFYDTVERVAGFWKNCSIEQDGAAIELASIPSWRKDMKEFNLRTLIEFCKEKEDLDNLTLYCAYWPLVFGPKEKGLFRQASDLSGFRDFLHEKQSVDAYYANPHFYINEDGPFGSFAVTEDCDSIFPIEPYVPFGVNDPETDEPLKVNRWYISYYSVTKDAVIGHTQYSDFIGSIEGKEYYDAGNVFFKGIPLGEMEGLVSKFGIEI